LEKMGHGEKGLSEVFCVKKLRQGNKGAEWPRLHLRGRTILAEQLGNSPSEEGRGIARGVPKGVALLQWKGGGLH